jgi:hypothetical protein
MKKTMTMQEHEALGASLSGIRNQLVHDLVAISNGIGKTRARTQTDRLRKVIELIDEVRCELEHEMLKDRHFPGLDNNDGALNVYYGPVSGCTPIERVFTAP